MQAVIIAGGKGTRISSITTTIPKLLLPLNNKPLVDYSINYLKSYSCDNIIICAGHLGYKIYDHIEKKDYGVSVRVFIEEQPLGTAGPLHLIKNSLESEFLVLFGDIYSTINLRKMIRFHKQNKADATLVLHHSDHPQDSMVVEIDPDSKLIKLVDKPGENWKKYGDLTKTSLYILNKKVINSIRQDKKVDFDEIFPRMLKKRKKLFGYVTEEYIKDMGTPQRYKEVQEYLLKVNSSS